MDLPVSGLRDAGVVVLKTSDVHFSFCQNYSLRFCSVKLLKMFLPLIADVFSFA